MSHQAVWPDSLIDRRRRAVDLENQIRAVILLRGQAAPSELAALRYQLRALPCPHWDVEPSATVPGSWTCSDCHDTITPAWVPLTDQEPSLRHAAQLRTAHHRSR